MPPVRVPGRKRRLHGWEEGTCEAMGPGPLPIPIVKQKISYNCGSQNEGNDGEPVEKETDIS